MKLTQAQIQEIQNKYQSGMSRYSLIRAIFPIQKMPSGALSYVDRDPYGICWDNSHHGFLKNMIECNHPDCVIRYVLDT